jgi:hypothetical protein
MSSNSRPPEGHLVEVEGTDRWVAGKSDQELINDLKVYLARLRDNPRSLPDRLRVAAIQLRLGRSEEALIHYEGVLRGYVQEGRITSAIALCRRILHHYPHLQQIKTILAALYARAPRGFAGAPSAVTPVSPEEQATTTFVLASEEQEEALTERNVVVDRMFADLPREQRHTPLESPAVDPEQELARTSPYRQVLRGSSPPARPERDYDTEEAGDDSTPMPLTHAKQGARVVPDEDLNDDPDGQPVILLTRKKPKKG